LNDDPIAILVQVKVEEARVHLNDLDEMIHLFPLTLSASRKVRGALPSQS